MRTHNALHTDLSIAQNFAYSLIKLTYKNLVPETESQDYGACTFQLNSKIVKFRIAKITPTKIGQFVTFWKRIGTGPIMPYDTHDPFDLLVVSVSSAENFGQFVFTKSVLLQKGILSKDGKNGKRAFRVYPPWDITDNAQAQKTQVWQLLYFVEIQPTLDTVQLKRLFL